MVPQAPEVSRQYGQLSRLTTSVEITPLARLSRQTVESRFCFPRSISQKENRNVRGNYLVMDRFQSLRATHARPGSGHIPPQITCRFDQGGNDLERGLDHAGAAL